MDTLIFGLLLVTTLAVIRSRPRREILALFAVSMLAMVLLFNHHATSSLNFRF
jgi:hypothetical protein